MAEEDPLGVGVDDKLQMPPSVEQHTVGRLGTHALERQQAFSYLRGRTAHHGVYPPAMFLDQAAQKGAEPASLDVEIAGGMQHLRQDGLGQGVKRAGLESD
jgi:hypothetical protein